MRLLPAAIGFAPLLSLPLGRGATAPTSLEAALAAIEVESIRRDVETIASDEMEGRDSPSAGLSATARYLAQGLADLDFEAGAPGGYLYDYPLAHLELDSARTRLAARGPGGAVELAFGEEWFIGRSSDVGEWDRCGPVVYLGASDEVDSDHLSLAGRWAIVREDGGTLRRLTERVQSAGAAGLLLVEEADANKTYAERFERTTGALTRARADHPSRVPDLSAAFPRAYLTRAAAERLFRAAGLEAEPAPGTALDLELCDQRHLSSPGGRAFLSNVCGFWRGSDPTLSRQVIVLSAHYDHVGRRGDEIWNGADDNASGTAGLLALARALATYGPMRRSILLLWVSAEERGLLGSEAWTLRPWLPEGCYPIANINIDMIGRNHPRELLLTPTRELEQHHNGIAQLVERLATSEGFERVKSADDYWSRSDHANFAKHLGLPVAFLFCDVHADYHRPTDTADKIDYDKLRRVTRLVLRVLEAMQAPDLELSRQAVPDAGSFREKVLVGTALRDLEELRGAADAWCAWKGGRPPGALEELVGFEAAGRTWLAGGVPRDPWGNAYHVRFATAEAPAVFECLGSDGAVGGEGLAADLRLD